MGLLLLWSRIPPSSLPMATIPKIARVPRYSVVAFLFLMVIWFARLNKQLAPEAREPVPEPEPEPAPAPPAPPSEAPPGPVPIPNIVHYVWVLSAPDGPLEFEFKHFVSIFSSHHYLRPETIYVHTNAPAAAVSRARASQHASSLWTRKILAAPAHRADIVRPGILRAFGGVYLAFDVVPLRESGFRNVSGHERNEQVHNGVMLAARGSRLMGVFERDQHEAFDARWRIAQSVQLLTRIANAMMAIPGEVLILERHAFLPGGGDNERHARLFRQHETEAAFLGDREISVDVMAGEDFSWWNWTLSRDGKRQDWEVDYSKAHTIHALSPPLHVANRTPACLDISWEYVMERSSNYAAQVYPAMSHADATMSISRSVAEMT